MEIASGNSAIERNIRRKRKEREKQFDSRSGDAVVGFVILGLGWATHSVLFASFLGSALPLYTAIFVRR